MGVKLFNTLIIRILFFSSILIGTLSRVVLPDDGFKFNCGFNLCTFPSMFCDIVKGICKYCNVDVCNLDDVPQQCYEACSEFLSDTISPVKPQTSRTGSDVITAQVDVSLGDIINITICGIILVLCVIILVNVAKPLSLCKSYEKCRIWQTEQKQINTGQNMKEHCIEMNDMQNENVSKRRKSTDQGMIGKMYNKNEHFTTEENASKCPLLQPSSHPKLKGAASLPTLSDKTRKIHTSPVASTEYGNHERQFDYKLLSPGNPSAIQCT